VTGRNVVADVPKVEKRKICTGNKKMKKCPTIMKSGRRANVLSSIMCP
jgi:hypothetical protein